MEVHRQICQKCGSKDVRNLIVRDPGRQQMIYVRCAACHELVARYRLSGYYHHGKGIDSFLRSQTNEAEESGRSHLRALEEIQHEALEGYERALQALKDSGKEV